MSQFFSPKDPREVDFFSFDFGQNMLPDETIKMDSWDISVDTGSDDGDLTTMFDGDSIITGTIVSQGIQAGNVGVTYLLTCTIETSNGRILIGDGLLPIEYKRGRR